MVQKEIELNPVKFAVWGFIILVGGLFLFGSFFIVGSGERGVVVSATGGTKQVSYGEGIHFKTPLIDNVEIVEVRTQKREADASAASKDLQTVHAKVAVNYHIEADFAWRLYQQVGTDFAGRIIDPSVQEVVKSVTATFNAEELITKRELVKDNIKLELRKRLQTYHIVLDDISITNFDFSPEFNNAIENKVTQEQNALAEENKLRVVQFQAQQKVAAAQGEAEAIRIINLELQKSPEYTKLQMISKWNGQLPQYVMDSNGNVFTALNLGQP